MSLDDDHWSLPGLLGEPTIQVYGIAIGFFAIAYIIISNLPSQYGSFYRPTVDEDQFNDEDKKNAAKSGYAYFQAHRDDKGLMTVKASVQVVVLGDIGRSPRMQYHALSIASNGGKVDLVGYVESEIHPDVLANKFITIVPLPAVPRSLRTSSKLLFLLVAPLKVLWQILTLYLTLAYDLEATRYMLIQNPPSIPTLIVARIVCFLRFTRLVIDWHNFGYTILALRLGSSHPLVSLAKFHEGFIARGADAHFAVSNAMCRALKSKWNITALCLHDRPSEIFQPLSSTARTTFLGQLSMTAPYASALSTRKTRLIVSPTSWTPDEDFSILLSALQTYSTATQTSSSLPALLVIITGRGPQQSHYLSQIASLTKQGKLTNITVLTAFLPPTDYAKLIASADLGISLHTSSSGVDLPMKVVDMFGAGLPVAGWNGFEAWDELVREGENGRGFTSADGLADVMAELLGENRKKLEGLREGAAKEGGRRWADEWDPVAGKLMGLVEK